MKTHTEADRQPEGKKMKMKSGEWRTGLINVSKQATITTTTARTKM